MDFERFKLSHGAQLEHIPQVYWQALFQKLCVEVYDAGKYFTMSPSQEEGWKVVVSAEGGVNKDDPSAIFLVDHAWTFQPAAARHQLLHIPGLANRMAALMGLTDVPTDLLQSGRGEGSGSEGADSYEADSESGDEKEAWSDEDTDTEVNKGVGSDDQNGDIPPKLTSELAKDGYSSGDLGDVSQYYVTEAPDEKDSDSDSGATPRKPLKVKPDLASSKEKSTNPLDKPVMGASVTMETVAPTESRGDVVVKEGASPGNEPVVDLPSENLVDKVLESIWKYCHAYHISNSPVPVWYVMDEFGSRIRQSCDPTVAMVSFFFIPTQLAFSLVWPLKDLSYAEEVTCNYLPECIESELGRACHALPWSCDSHLTLDNPLWKELDNFTIPEPQERSNEMLPDPTHATPPPAVKSQYIVYTDMKLVQMFLTHPSFKLTGSKKTADILWLSDHFKDFRSLPPDTYINQFACENVLTCKDLLALTARRAKRAGASSSSEREGPTSSPSWLPLTFNLLYELPHFVHHHLKRKEKGEENTWIVKPWNLGRGLDIHITNNLHQVIRLAQAGPKIVSKYISNPVLFQREDLVGGVKFDVRYVLLLSSVSPTVLHVYNVFWLRFANKPFSMDHFTDYDKHFTVMNYREESHLKQIHSEDFVPLFNQQYPDHPWAKIQEKIFTMFKELFLAAGSATPPAGLAPFKQSRAMYAADLMLEWVNGESDTGERNMEPRLLEINFIPDCVRACKYHPDFFNHVFEVLFIDENSRSHGLPVTRLL